MEDVAIGQDVATRPNRGGARCPPRAYSNPKPITEARNAVVEAHFDIAAL